VPPTTCGSTWKTLAAFLFQEERCRACFVSMTQTVGNVTAMTSVEISAYYYRKVLQVARHLWRVFSANGG
jgi:hypothetical protein